MRLAARSFGGSVGRSVGRSLDALAPHRCAVCGRTGLEGLDLCAACLWHLPTLVDPADRASTPCVRCGDVGCPARGAPVCAPCAGRAPVFERIVAPYRYERPLDALVRRWKHDGDRPLGRVLGTLLGRAAAAPSAATDRPAPAPDCLLAVPTHPSRLAVRGFDHGADLARWAGRAAGVPVLDAARRIEDTGSLAELSRAERALVVRGAFRVDGAVRGRRVAIVDDVLTTGSSAGELARECHDTGAASVALWVVARTPSARPDAS